MRIRSCASLGLFCIGLIFAIRSGAVGAASAPASQGGRPALASESKSVKVTTRREGEVTHFMVENNELCEITMTFEVSVLNLKGSVGFPCTITFPPRQVTEAFTLSPVDLNCGWEYTYTNYYKLGSHYAQHQNSYVYQLPYAPGSKFRVTQGYNGTFSHTGPNKYSIDWKMPEGTPVYAARGGTVVKVKDDSATGGPSLKYDSFNNYVLIRHEDGTLGHYCHLQKGACGVKAGQLVHAGQLIGRSGNTGFSSGPHLHFCVYKTRNGRERQSIPVKFKTADEKSVTLRTGRNYEAVEVQNADARVELGSGQGGTQ